MNTSALARLFAPVLLIAALAGFWSWLAVPGLFDRLDWPTHACWLHGFETALAEGVLQPRWLAPGNAGFGAPVFVFYSPGAYYIGSALLQATGDIGSALKTLQSLALPLLAASTFLWLRGIGTSRWFAICAALLTMLLPQLSMLSLRFNMPPAALALAAVPLVLLARERCDGSRSGPLGLALVFALLVYIHLLTAFQLALLLSALLPWDAASAATRRRALRVAFGLLLGSVLAAPVLLPAMLEGHLVDSSALLAAPHKAISQNLMFGSADSNWTLWPEAKFIETATVLLGALILLAGLRLLHRGIQHGRRDHDALQALVAAAICCWLMTAASNVLYTLFEPLQYLQYGWRWQGLAALMLLRGAWVKPVAAAPDSSAGRTLRLAAVPATAALLLALGWQGLALYGTLPHPQLHELPRTDAASVTHAARSCPRPTPEYRLKELPEPTGATGSTSLRSARPMFLRGRGSVAERGGATHLRVFQARADVPATLLLPIAAWPGWTASIGASTTAAGDRPTPLPLRNHGGLLAIDVPSGDHVLTVRVGPAEVERVANLLASLALALMSLWLVLAQRRHPRR